MLRNTNKRQAEMALGRLPARDRTAVVRSHI